MSENAIRRSADCGLCGLVLGAGLSTRMGGYPKPLLTAERQRFVERVLETLSKAEVDDRLVVLGHEHEAVTNRADLGSASVLINEEYESGMLSSVQAGVTVASDLGVDGIYLWPVDYPFVTPGVVSYLRDAFRTGSADVVIPTVDGERGHPTVFGASTFERLLDAPEDEGARAVVYADETAVDTVPVDEQRILVDIDTPGEYWDAVKQYELEQ